MITSKIETDIHALMDKYPSFSSYSKLKNGILVYGYVELKDACENIIWEKYDIKILVLNEYPFKIPKCYLASKNIPWIHDRHLEQNGECCMMPMLEEYIILGENYVLIDYLEKIVIPFFAAQKLFDLKGKWPHGEYSHSEKGLKEYYSAKLLLNNDTLVISALMILAGEVNPGRNDLCFCKSGKKYKKCHLVIFEQFPIRLKSLFKDDLNMLKICEQFKIKPSHSNLI
jgi:hypothetical protein